MSLELRQLRHLLAVADHGSFARAADALQLSQPALSRSIQTLEVLLGAVLFHRRSSGTVPTDAGRLFIDRARQVVQLADSLDREALTERLFQYGKVTVGSGPYPAQTIIAAALARFTEASPRVTARVLVRDWDDLLRGLQRSEIDFFVAETSTMEKDASLAIERLAEHPLYFVARAGHALAGRRAVTTPETLAYPLIALNRISPRVLEPMRRAQRRALDAGILPRAFPAAECGSQGVATQIVHVSDAIMVAALPSVARELERRELVVLGSEPWLHLRYGIVKLKGRAMSAEAEQLLACVIEAERTTTLEEERLLARWAPHGSTRREAGHPGVRRRSRPGSAGA
jgi:DNA-binding transcriptional LysR family regulator